MPEDAGYRNDGPVLLAKHARKEGLKSMEMGEEIHAEVPGFRRGRGSVSVTFLSWARMGLGRGGGEPHFSICSGDSSNKGLPFTMAALLIKMVGVPSCQIENKKKRNSSQGQL